MLLGPSVPAGHTHIPHPTFAGSPMHTPLAAAAEQLAGCAGLPAQGGVKSTKVFRHFS